MPAGSRDARRWTTAATAPVSSVSVPRATAAYASHSRRVEGRWPVGGEVRPGRLPRQRLRRPPGGGQHGGDARLGGDRRRVDLGGHATGSDAAGADAARLDALQVGQAVHLGDLAGVALARVAVVEAVDVGQQDQRVRPGDVGDQRREPVVIAEPDLVGGHRVVLVDHRDHSQLKEPVQGALGVPVVAAPHQVIGGEQHLPGAQAVQRERRRVPGDQQPLPDARSRLLGGQVPWPPGQPERRHPGRDRARGHQEHLAAGRDARGDGRDERRDALIVDRAAPAGERGRPDLDDDPARGGDVVARGTVLRPRGGVSPCCGLAHRLPF